jgi:hypothetical protein
MKHSNWFRKGVEGIQRPSQKTLNTRIYACTPINSFQAIAPLMAHEKGVHFLGEHISLKNLTFCPLFSHDTSSFKDTCFLV